MNIGIITHYDVHNHGAVLQLNGLAAFLRANGHQSHALQFDKNYDFLGVGLKSKYDLSLKSIPIYLNYLLKYGLRRTLFNIKKKRLLSKFKDKNDLIGPYYSHASQTDAVVIGSDEVFALHTGPTPILFGYASPGKKTISYAASFGPTTLEEIERLNCLEFVKGGLSRLDNISVRDMNSKSIVSNLLGIEVPIVLDPVLLYGYSSEISRMQAPKMPKYLVVYAYDNNLNNPDEVAAIKNYALKKGLIIVSPGFYHKWADKNINIDPLGLLNYIKFAECVVTDTFHGSVTSIICNTPMAVIVRSNANKLRYLLSEYNLESRIVVNLNHLSAILETPLDFGPVNNTIEAKRQLSSDFILSSLNEHQ